MRTRLAFSILSITLILGACIARVSAADIFDTPAWQEKVTYDMVDVRFGTILKGLIEPTGTSYSIDHDYEVIKIPSFAIKDCPRKNAFTSLIKTAGLTYKIDGDKILLLPNEGPKNSWLQHLSIDFTAVALGSAVESVFKQADSNYVIDPDAASLTIASLQLKDVTLYEALDAMLDGAGAKIVNTAGVAHIVPKSATFRPTTAEPSLVNVNVKPGKGSPWARRTDIEVKDAKLGEVVEKLLMHTGLNYSVSLDAHNLAVKSLKLTDVTLRQAFDAVMKMAGATYSEQSGVIAIQAKSPIAAAKNSVCLDLKEMPLPEALKCLFKGSGINYVLEPSISQMHVTAALENVTFESALDSLARAAGLSYRIENGVYHVYAISPAVSTPQTVTPADKCTEEITLKQVTADYIMQALGIDINGHPITSQQFPVAPPDTSTQALAGIESVTPGKSESTLVIVGRKKAVGELRNTIERLDVRPRAIQVTAEYYEDDLSSSADLDASDKLFSSGDTAKAARIAKALKAKLQEAGTRPLNNLIFSLLNRTHAQLAVQTCIPSQGADKPITSKSTLSAAPCINDDGTITTTLSISFDPGWQWAADAAVYTTQNVHLSTKRRVAPGDPVVLGGFCTRPGKMAVIFVTEEILD